jgi:hypothetical protein
MSVKFSFAGDSPAQLRSAARWRNVPSGECNSKSRWWRLNRDCKPNNKSTNYLQQAFPFRSGRFMVLDDSDCFAVTPLPRPNDPARSRRVNEQEAGWLTRHPRRCCRRAVRYHDCAFLCFHRDECTLNEIACSKPEAGRRTGGAGALICRNDHGAIRAKTIAPMARRGIISRTIMPARELTAGPKTASPASATITSACVSRSPFGTA